MNNSADRPEVLFWLGATARPGDCVTLDDVESKHLLRVLRRPPGERVTLADGEGGWLEGRLVSAEGRAARIEILSTRSAPTEPRHDLHLGFPMLRPARTELLLEKCTELGVTRFTPVVTERGTRFGGRADRWNRILRTATLQSLRSKPPELLPERTLDDWIAGLGPDFERFVARQGGSVGIGACDRGRAGLVGPEGDLTPGEWDFVLGKGFVPVDLGPRRLRSETAAVVLAARLSAVRV